MKTITALLASLLLAGCGQAAERPYQPREEPAPATGAAGTSPTPTRETSAPPASDRPASVDVGDLRVRIDWPGQDTALLRLFPDYYLAKYRAVFSGDDGHLRHADPMFREEAIRWAREFTDGGYAVAGRSRLYRLKVNAIVGRGAEVDVCVDETRMKVVAGTGEPVTPQPTSIRTPYLQRMLARKGDDGRWRIKQIAYGTEGCSR
ncbi:hypothetical protein OUY22_17915 [Nonomuraea sp. MCN248]|uniref:Lipoprotein n=1 Tax=Nonomuraea corallina TaxID=2989783 RepID=A0ABT4SDN0_9ACTN|nr:hypothetical protein [Nonomuraea corallina]MDA0635301.1 hypothetical protein [Nonomuraea corallina]